MPGRPPQPEKPNRPGGAGDEVQASGADIFGGLDEDTFVTRLHGALIKLLRTAEFVGDGHSMQATMGKKAYRVIISTYLNSMRIGNHQPKPGMPPAQVLAERAAFDKKSLEDGTAFIDLVAMPNPPDPNRHSVSVMIGVAGDRELIHNEPLNTAFANLDAQDPKPGLPQVLVMLGHSEEIIPGLRPLHDAHPALFASLASLALAQD